jgi:hypothetical protein
MFDLRCIAFFGRGEDGVFYLSVLMFDLYVVTLNSGVVSCYNPLEKVLVFPGFETHEMLKTAFGDNAMGTKQICE